MNNNSLHITFPKSTPAWAKPRIQQLLAEGEKLESRAAEAPDGFVMRRLSDEQAVLGHWTNRNSFARTKFFDKDDELGRDQNPEPNIVDFGWSEFHLNGGYDDGQMIQITEDREAVNVVLHNGSVTRNVDVRKSGSAFYSRQDAKNPENSVSFETESSRKVRNEDRKSEHYQATASMAQSITERKGESLEEMAANLFFHQRDEIPEVRAEVLSSITSEIQKLPTNEKKKVESLLKKLDGNTPRRLTRQLLNMGKQDSALKLEKLKDLAGAWQVLEDAPKIMSDGLVRTQEFYVPPGALQLRAAAQGWDFDKESGLPIADTIIVGGGPGGLATGFHMSEQGQRTILFEGGKIGQAFSDASAQSVHQLRTTSQSSDLIYTNSRTDIGIDVSLRRQAEGIFHKGQQAKAGWNKLRGEDDHSSNEGFGALNRNNIFEHMVQIGHGLATKYPDTMVTENSPVTKLEKLTRGDETFIKVTSEQGHEVLTRSLVMATGFVGSNGENARSLKQFSDIEQNGPDKVTLLGSDHDLVRKNEQLLDDSQSLVFSDRLLGRPEIRERVKSLPPGSRLAIIGSGESAAKGTIEALQLNPQIVADLYTKNPLEPYQVQIPVSHFGRTVTEQSIQNEDLAEQTLREFEELKTPITTETMKTLLTLEAEGRLRVREMGKRFDEKTVEVNHRDGRFEFDLKDQEVSESLKRQSEAWQASGLYGASLDTSPADQLPGADMVMMAVGYNTSKVNASPLMQQLIDQNLVEIKDGRVQYGEDGLTSSLSSVVGFNTASAVRMSSDTALPGRAVRGLRLAQNLATKLPERDEPTAEDSIRKGLEAGALDTNNEEEFPVPDLDFAKSSLSFKTNGFLEDQLSFDTKRANGPDSQKDKDWGKKLLDLEIKFAGPNSTVRALVGRYLEYPDTLTAAEKLTAQRALEIADRLESSESH